MKYGERVRKVKINQLMKGNSLQIEEEFLKSVSGQTLFIMAAEHHSNQYFFEIIVFVGNIQEPVVNAMRAAKVSQKNNIST